MLIQPDLWIRIGEHVVASVVLTIAHFLLWKFTKSIE